MSSKAAVVAVAVVGEQLGRPAPVSEPSRSRRPRLGERANSASRLSGGAPGSPVRSSGGQLPRDHRVAADRPQERQLRVDPAQDRRATCSSAGRRRGSRARRPASRAVGQRVRPRAEPPAQRRRRLQQRDGHPALGQHHRRADARDAAADDHGLGARRDASRGSRGSGATTARGRMRSGAAREVREGEPSTRVEPRCAPAAPRPDPAGPTRKPLGAPTRGMRGRGGWRRHDRRTRPHRDLAAPRPAHPAPGQGGRGARLRRDLDRRLPARRPVPRPRSCSTPPAASPSPPASSTCGARPPPRSRRPTTGSPRRTPAASCSASASATPRPPQEYRSPYDTIVDYLDVLDAEGVPVEDRVLAALGPKVLALAARAHARARTPTSPRRSTPASPARSSATGPLLAPEQKVVLDTDPVARPRARPARRRPPLPAPAQLHEQPAGGWAGPTPTSPTAAATR